TSFDRHGLDTLAAAQRTEYPSDRVQVLRDRAPLDHRVRFLDLVERIGAVQEDRSGIDPRIDAQERHAYAIQVAARQRPEAAVRVAILGADPRMHHERAD